MSKFILDKQTARLIVLQRIELLNFFQKKIRKLFGRYACFSIQELSELRLAFVRKAVHVRRQDLWASWLPDLTENLTHLG